MKRKKFFIFDLDGTLLNNTHIGFMRVNQNLEMMGMPPVSEKFLRSHWGIPAKDIWKLICEESGATPEKEELLLKNDVYMSKIMDYKASAKLMLAIAMVKKFDIFTGILTSRTAASLDVAIKQTGLDLTLFDYIQTITHFPYHKPNGRVFGPAINWAMAKKLLPEDIVYFGDTIKYDYAATLNANPPLDFVGIISGVNTYEEFLAAGLPTCRITTYEKLPHFLHHSIKELVEA